MLFCSLKNVLFYNYSTCEITLTLACLLTTRPSPSRSHLAGLGPAEAPAGPGPRPGDSPGPPPQGASAFHLLPLQISEVANLEPLFSPSSNHPKCSPFCFKFSLLRKTVNANRAEIPPCCVTPPGLEPPKAWSCSSFCNGTGISSFIIKCFSMTVTV